MTLDSLPDLDTSGLCLVKTLSTALTCWPYRNTALRDGARTSTRTSSVAKGRTASIHCRPAPPRQTEALSSRTSLPERRSPRQPNPRALWVADQALERRFVQLAVAGGLGGRPEFSSERLSHRSAIGPAGRRRRAQAGDVDVGPSPSTPGTSTPGRRGERRRRPIASTWRAEGAGRPEPSSRPTRHRRSRPVQTSAHR